MVELTIPPITVKAMPNQMDDSSLMIIKGIRPTIVVKVVIIIGRTLLAVPSMIAESIDKPDLISDEI